MQPLRTARLLLEPQLAEHAGAMFAVLADPALYAYLDYLPPPSVEHLRGVFERQQARRSPDGRQHWLNWVMRRPGAAPIGYVQATVEADSRAWIAYVLASSAWGHGYAREATAAMLEHLAAVYGTTRFLAVVEAANQRSIALLKHLGFDEAAAGDPMQDSLSPTERAFIKDTRMPADSRQGQLFAAADDDAPPPATAGPGIAVGTCSWTDASLIKSKGFYPRGVSSAEQRLAYYASQFPVVEVDSSYFALPSPTNSVLWAQRTPADFSFNIKAFRLLTGHQTPPAAFPPDLQPLLPPLAARQRHHYYAEVPAEIRDELWRRFIIAIAPLREAGKLKAVHFQFAPWVVASEEWIAHVEDCVQRMAGHLLALEFRNATWFGSQRAAATLAWERELGVVHTVVDEPQGVGNYAQGVWEATHAQLAIVRLHGRNAATWDAKGLTASSERFNYEYGDDELEQLAQRVVALADKAFVVQVLVNVNFEDQGIRAARRLEALLARLAPSKVLQR